MTKDEARDAAWTMMNSGIDGTLDSGHDYFDNGFDAGYDFAKSEDRWNVIERDGLPPNVGDYIVTNHRDEVIVATLHNLEQDEAYWRYAYTAWRPLPEPYKEAK